MRNRHGLCGRNRLRCRLVGHALALNPKIDRCSTRNRSYGCRNACSLQAVCRSCATKTMARMIFAIGYAGSRKTAFRLSAAGFMHIHFAGCQPTWPTRRIELQSDHSFRLSTRGNKMSVHLQPIAQLTHRARIVLVNELGAVDAMRFLNQFRAGNGDYTNERGELFRKDSVKSIVADIKAQRKSG
jgi:hypothetical protein